MLNGAYIFGSKQLILRVILSWIRIPVLTISFLNNKQPLRSLTEKWEEQYFLYTKDPIKEIWNTLQDFTSFEYLKKYLNDRINDSKINEIAKLNLKENSHDFHRNRMVLGINPTKLSLSILKTILRAYPKIR